MVASSTRNLHRVHWALRTDMLSVRHMHTVQADFKDRQRFTPVAPVYITMQQKHVERVSISILSRL